MTDSPGPKQSSSSELPPDAPRHNVPPRRSSLRQTESTRRTPPESSSDSVPESTPRVRPEAGSGAEKPPQVGVPESSGLKSGGDRRVSSPRPRGVPPKKGSPPAPRRHVTASPTSSQESDVKAVHTQLVPQDSEASRLVEAADGPVKVSEEVAGSQEGDRSVSPPPSVGNAPPRQLKENESVGQDLSVETPAILRKSNGDARPAAAGEKAPSSRRKEGSVRSSRLAATDEKVITSTQRVERLERMLLVPKSGALQTFLPSIENPRDLKRFVEADLALSILKRLEALEKTTGLGTDEPDIQINPLWTEPSNRDKNEKVLKLIYDLLFGMSQEEKGNELLVREKTMAIEEAFKEISPDVSSSWAQTVLTEMSRLRSQSQMLAWIGGIMQKRCRTAVLNLDSRVNKLQYSLEGPLNYARIVEGWTEIESRKTYVLGNEEVIRFVTDQCRRAVEMNSLRVSSTIPSQDTLNQLRSRLDRLQGEVADISKEVAAFDKQLMEVSTKIQTANQLFTSLVLEMAI